MLETLGELFQHGPEHVGRVENTVERGLLRGRVEPASQANPRIEGKPRSASQPFDDALDVEDTLDPTGSVRRAESVPQARCDSADQVLAGRIGLERYSSGLRTVHHPT